MVDFVRRQQSQQNIAKTIDGEVICVRCVFDGMFTLLAQQMHGCYERLATFTRLVDGEALQNRFHNVTISFL